jgi:hypothetical protein
VGCRDSAESGVPLGSRTSRSVGPSAIVILSNSIHTEREKHMDEQNSNERQPKVRRAGDGRAEEPRPGMTRAESTGQAEQEAPEKVSEKLSRAGEEASAATTRASAKWIVGSRGRSRLPGARSTSGHTSTSYAGFWVTTLVRRRCEPAFR